MYLILSGHHDITLEQFDNIPVSSDGTSLLALRDAIRQFQDDAELLSYRPEDIDSLCLPAIIHLKLKISSFAQYHFDVAYKVDRESVLSHRALMQFT